VLVGCGAGGGSSASDAGAREAGTGSDGPTAREAASADSSDGGQTPAQDSGAVDAFDAATDSALMAAPEAGTDASATAHVKFHPGWYISLDPNAGPLSSWLQVIKGLKGVAKLRGIYLVQRWKWFEPAKDTYTAGSGGSATGFAAVDQLLAEATADGFQLIMAMDGKEFGAGCSGSCDQVPAYFDTLACADGAPGYLSTMTPASGSEEFTAKLYDPAVTARYVAMVAAYGARYDANPAFEMFRDATESANGLFSATQVAAMPAQYAAWVQAARKAFPTTSVSLSTNFLNDASQLATLFASVLQPGVFIGGPDTKAAGLNTSYVPGNGKFDSISNIVFNGYIGSDRTPATAIDYRGRLGWFAETQTPEETWNTQSPLDTYNAMFGVTTATAQGGVSFGGDMKPQYFVFSLGFFQPNSWTAAQVTSFIEAGHPVETTAPSGM
jgi:hypothetical protein